MKKLLAAVLFSLPFLVPLSVSAQTNLFETCNDAAAKNSVVCRDAATGQANNEGDADNSIYGPNGVITKVANLIAVVVGAVAVIVIIISGLQIILAVGDASKIATARNSIIYAVIGLVVVVVAQLIIRLVLSNL